MSKTIAIIREFVLFGAAVLTLGSCSDWTDTENIKLSEPDITTQNPVLYATYLQSLRDYKQSAHRVMIAKFNNLTSYPAGQGEHISALPDSIDYVILNSPDNLNETIAQEMSEIRTQKGTKTLYSIDYGEIETAYKAKLEAEQEATAQADKTAEEGGDETSEADGFLSFLEQQMDEKLALFSKYGYDGINFIYNGVSLLGLTEEEKTQLTARQNVFFGKMATWKAANPNALMFFEGTPQELLYDTAILSQATYIILPTTEAVSIDELLLQAELSIADEVPADRFVFGVNIPKIDGDDESGYFNTTDDNGDQQYAVVGAALAVISSRGDFSKLGVCVDRAELDYYNATNVYKNIREAISLMNPSK